VASGRESGFLSKSELMIALITGGTEAGSSGGWSSVIAARSYFSVSRTNGSFFVYNSYKMIPRAQMSTFVVEVPPFTTSGAM
jgi:hypothetical protein